MKTAELAGKRALVTGSTSGIGLAVARALEELGVEGVQLKWPNDVLVNGHKIAGILIELVSGRGQPLAAVIGVGINLRLPPEAARAAARALQINLPQTIAKEAAHGAASSQ